MVDGASEPFSAWGQMFPYFFKPGKVAVVNLAESGETLSGFIAARRFAKMLSLMKPGIMLSWSSAIMIRNKKVRGGRFYHL
ncbi:hypothetical protein KRR40_07380 [Niabella defluvii]|nr:hypothetical protein KRR40_07380 [Niabella sp. I65]